MITIETISPEQSTAMRIQLLRVSGRIELFEAPELRDLLVESAAADLRLVVSLGDVEYIDSSGLGALLTGLRAIERAGGQLRLADASSQVRTVLNLTRLDSLLPVCESIAAAVQSFTDSDQETSTLS